MEKKDRFSNKLFAGLLVIAVALLLFPSFAQGQLGIDPCCAIISAGLKSISSLLSDVVAKPLASIQQNEQQLAQFEQQVVWPASAINQAKQVVVQSQSQFTQTTNLSHLSVASASLPNTQALENLLLSRNASNLPAVNGQFRAVYGAGIAQSDASPQVRDVSDMADAEAEAAVKKAVELDAIADVQLKAAEQINQRLQTAAPGSVAILEAEAATWELRGNAYSQEAMAELLRIRSVQLAGQGAQLKVSSSHTRTLNGATGAVVKQETR